LFSKINIFPIIIRHFSVLKNDTTKKLSVGDVFLFYGVPILFGIANFVWLKFDFSSVRADVVTFGSILSGFMLSTLALLLVFFESLKQQDAKMKETYNKKKLVLIEETSLSILYGIVAGVILTLIAVVSGVENSYCAQNCENMTDSFLAVLSTHFLLIFLMVVKRTFVLMTAMVE